MFSIRRTFLLLAIVLIRAALCSAQGLYDFDTRPARGVMPTSDQLATPFDNIDSVNGKLHLKIPLVSLPRGRGGSGFDLDLNYDSHLYDILPASFPPAPGYESSGPRIIHALAATTSTGGWRYNFLNYRLELELREGVNMGSDCPVSEQRRVYRFRVGLPDGSFHVLHMRGYADEFGDGYTGDGFFGIAPDGKATPCAAKWGWPSQLPTGWLTYYTADGSFLKLEIYVDGTTDWANKSWRLYFPDGRRVTGTGITANELFDANGNRIRLIGACSDPPPAGDCSQPYFLIVDDSGREIRIDYNVTDANIYQATLKRDTVTALGPNGNISWAIDWEAIHIGADGRKYQWSYSPPNDAAYQLANLDFRMWVIKYIQLPLQAATPLGSAPAVWNSYVFGYSDDSDDGYGELDLLRTPGGASYTYRYNLEATTFDTNGIAHNNFVKQKTINHDGGDPLQWTYTFNVTSSTVTNPDGGQITNTFYVRNVPWDWKSGLVYRIDQPLGTVHKRTWARNKAYGLSSVSNNSPNNPYIARETVTAGDQYGNPSKTAVTDFSYDKNGNLLARTEYDWVSYAGSTVEAGTVIKRKTDYVYHVEVPEAASNADHVNAYWRPHNYSLWSYASARRLDAVWRRTVSPDGVAISAVTEFDYDSPYTKANLTFEKRWDNVKSAGVPGLGGLNSGNSQVLSRSYDGYGNLTDIYEPEVRTRISYDPSGDVATRIDYAFGTSAQRSWQYSWNATKTAVDTKTDLDNGIATSYTYDNVGRVRTVTEAGLRRSETIYDDAAGKVTTKSDVQSYLDGRLQAITHYDQLGRVKLIQTSDGSPLGGDTSGIKVKTRYIQQASTNRVVVTSSPYRSTSFGDPTQEWTCTQYDRLGRVTVTAVFKGSSEPSNCESNSNRTAITRTTYDADWTILTDPASKTKKERRDGPGRLVLVTEDPAGLSYNTDYEYDALDNLTKVIQGSQTRTFVYSSLGWLRSATNPESGTTSYTYYDNGEVNTRTDARNIVAAFTYDPQHRVLTKSYTDGTPAVSYDYHLASSSSPNIGQLKSISSSAASTVHNSYNALGQVMSSTHSISGYGGSLPFTYDWWRNGALKSIQYPSGRLVNYTVDDAGRITKVSSPGKTYADLTVSTNPFAPDGRIAQMRLGNNLWETRDYRTPASYAQPSMTYMLGTSMGSGDRMQLEYYYPNGSNNGNLMRHVIRQPNRAWTQDYYYDGVNRLDYAYESGGFSRDYGYDRYGNRWLNGASFLTYADTHEPTSPSNFDAATNRLNVAGSQYDTAGNQTFFTPFTLGYDAENRNTTVTSSSNGTGFFAYDGEGRRVKKVWTPSGGAAITTYYVYDALGQLAAEYSNQAASPGTSYIFSDMLGSARAVTNSSGGITECYDYLPFGRLLSSSDNQRNTGCFPPNPENQLTSALPQKFTGKERDSGTNLDYFGARYYSAAQGRFSSPDSMSGLAENPQSWNKYSYTFNNPVRYVDPDGKWPTEIHKGIIAGAFLEMSRDHVSLMQGGSFAVDFSLRSQTLPAYAHEHGMLRPGESADDAARRTAAFVFEHLARATVWQDRKQGIVAGDALTEFGKAMHPVMDRQSPAHANQVFEGVPGNLKNLLSEEGVAAEIRGILIHGSKESKISRSVYRKAVDEVRRNYLKTFGKAAFKKATGCDQVEGCVYDYTLLGADYWRD